MKHLNPILWCLGSVITGSVAAAELPPRPPETAPPAIREIAPGEWSVGEIRLSKNTGTVTIPAKVNLTEGLLEYLLVHQKGKTHESLFSTEVPPYHLQIAMLLLGAKGADPKLLTNAPSSGPITNADLLEYRPPPVPGDLVELSVRWPIAGTNITHRMESLVLNKKAGEAMRKGPWVFSGSMVWEGAFIAQIDGSIMAIITDIGAMFNSAHPDRDRDSLWFIREKILPSEGSEVKIVVKMLKNSETKAGRARPLKERDEKD